jgi:hypothetical protein
VQFFLTNFSRQSFTVVATTNLALPIAQWEVLGAPTSLGDGVYHFFDHDTANYPQRFYRLRWP